LSSFAEKNFKFFWNFNQLQNHINDKDSYDYFCYFKGKLVAYILFNLNPFTNQAHLYQVCVDHSFRKNQLATELIIKALDAMGHNVHSVYLEVEVDNLAAISFYNKLGFNQLNKINSFYSDGSDAYAMHLNSSELAKLQRY
jgi:ribosomal-protein-alanine N-acetyltransferase